MKTQLNEIKRMQQLAGLINENQINEEDSTILDLINDYKSNAYSLDQGYGLGIDEMEAEQENIKEQSEEDEIFDKLKGNFSSPVAEHALLVKLVQLSRDYTYYNPRDMAYAAEKALSMIQSGNHTDSYNFGDNE
jgi:hypothetical protein